MASKVVTFQMERETKNTVRYAEASPDDTVVIGTLYVQKEALKGLTPRKEVIPSTLSVTIEAE